MTPHTFEDTLGLLRDFLAFQREMGVTVVPHLPASSSGSKDAYTEPAADGDDLGRFATEVAECQACKLCGGRTQVVFGTGLGDADLMFVGEAPGFEEDRRGVPFVGAAGELLTRMIEAMGLSRDDIYIANVIKCRPPNNRDPEADEIAACEPLLKRQIALVEPRIICTLGRFAAQTLLKTSTSMGRLRGRLYDYEGVKVIPTYHPAALLRNPQWKHSTWEDLKQVRYEYDRVRI